MPRTPEPSTHGSADLQRIAEKRLNREKAELLDVWLDAGGDEADFEAAWPEIRAQLGQNRVADIGEKARARSLRNVSGFR